MADLISRAAALDAIDGMKPMQGNMEQLVMKALCWAAVKTIQPVEAVPVVHGRWEQPFINRENGSASHDFRCSACRRYRFHNGEMRRKYKYCPNCGAKMDGERRDDDEAD